MRVLAAYPELGSVQDAVRLDALRAVGVGRGFYWGGVRRGEEEGLDGALTYFREKLSRLSGMVKTTRGRELAEVRTRRVRVFLEWWEEEVGDEMEEGEIEDFARGDLVVGGGGQLWVVWSFWGLGDLGCEIFWEMWEKG